MRGVLISALALATVGWAAPPSGAGQPAAATSGPVRLTEAQMDRVTAGLVAIDISALANAAGPHARTRTSTVTDATRSQRGGVEVAFGMGRALAAGDEPWVELSASLHADGDYVFAFTLATDLSRQEIVAGQILTFVVSIDRTSPIGRIMQQRAVTAADRVRVRPAHWMRF